MDETQLLWHWQDNDTSYSPFNNATSKEIENLKIGETCTFGISQSNATYTINKISNHQCEQRNTITNYKRNVLHIDQLEYAWFWKDSNKLFKPYSYNISKEIEQLNIGESYYLIAKNMKYQIQKISKNQCEQTNINSNTVRLVVRKLVHQSTEQNNTNTLKEMKENKYDRDECINIPTLRIGCVGAGQVATKILSAMINRNIFAKNSSIIISDPYTEQLQKIYKTLMNSLGWNRNNIKIDTTTNNKKCIQNCDVVFVAVRPEHLPPIMTELYSYWTGNEIIVVISQVEFEILQTKLTNKPNQAILRIMPAKRNDVESIILAKGEQATINDVKLVAKILREMGVIKITDEKRKAIELQPKGFVAKQNGERLEAIARIILIGVYDDNNIWSCLRGMRFIVRDIWQFAMDFNKHYWYKFIETGNSNLFDPKTFVKQKKHFTFPIPKDININMMPFMMTDEFEDSYLPKYLQQYWQIIKYCINNDVSQLDQIGYITIHESWVDKGRSQRRPGLHIETPGMIYIKDENNKNIEYIKGAGNTGKKVNMAAYWASWGGGSYSGNMYDYYERDGIYMASSVDNTCAIWNCKIIPYSNCEVIGHLGDIEHLRCTLSDDKKMNMDANVMYWLTDRTPHEALPVKERTYRQFFRLVTKNVNLWYKLHSTPNPYGVIPDAKVTRIIKESKFITAQKPQDIKNN